MVDFRFVLPAAILAVGVLTVFVRWVILIDWFPETLKGEVVELAKERGPTENQQYVLEGMRKQRISLGRSLGTFELFALLGMEHPVDVDRGRIPYTRDSLQLVGVEHRTGSLNIEVYVREAIHVRRLWTGQMGVEYFEHTFELPLTDLDPYVDGVVVDVQPRGHSVEVVSSEDYADRLPNEVESVERVVDEEEGTYTVVGENELTPEFSDSLIGK